MKDLQFVRASRVSAVGHGAPSSWPRALAASMVAVCMWTASANAHLGGFEGADGYEPFLNMVQHYNAGQYGAASGYPIINVYTPITPNTGLWVAIAGGYNSGSGISYASGHQWLDRDYVNGTGGTASDLGLILTTNHEGWGGAALEYEYSVDSQDLGGTAPLSTGSSIIKVSYWVCAALPGPELGGQVADGYFGDAVTFLDSSGNAGAIFGLTQRASGDKVTYWDGSTMFESTIVGASGKYDRWDITLDLATDTFSADYFQFASSTLTPVVVSAPMMAPMADLSKINFRSSPGVNNSKLMSVDDFSFEVEETQSPCAEVSNVDILCALDDSGEYTVTFDLTNNSGQEVKYITVAAPAGYTVEPDLITLPAVLPDGGTTSVSFTFTGGMPGDELCFFVGLNTPLFKECCSLEVCITVPDCDCAQVHDEKIDCIEGTNDYSYSFTLDNLFGDDIYHAFLIPVTPDSSVISFDDDHFDLPPLADNGSINLNTIIHGGTPGEEICFLLSVHNENLEECCAIEVCITLPVCDNDCFEIVKPFGFWEGQELRYCFYLQNNSAQTVDTLHFNPPSPMTIIPDPVSFPPVAPGGLSSLICVSITGATQGTGVCMDGGLYDKDTFVCTDEICIDVPICDEVWGGYPFGAIGPAALDLVSISAPDDILIVSAVGTGSVFGASVDVGSASETSLTWFPVDPIGKYADGLFLEAAAYGVFNGVPDQFLGTLRVTDVGSQYLVTADFSSIGSSTQLVQVLDRTEIRAEFPGHTGAVGTASSLPDGLGKLAAIGGFGTSCYAGDFPPGTAFVINGQTIIGDELRVLAELPKGPVEFISDFQVVAFGAPFIALNGVQVTQATSTCLGDVNGDGTIDPLDAGFVSARFNCPVGTGDVLCDAADANTDGVVDPLDAGYVQSRFGTCD